MAAPLKRYPTIAACGLDCGLCPRYYTRGKSRCPGCCGPGFEKKHPTCSFITCCVKKRSLETCGGCPDFPCAKFKTVEEYRAEESASYPPARKILPNLCFIKKHGLARFVARQRQRIRLLEAILDRFDDGRSRSFYCRACALLGPGDLKAALAAARRETAAPGFPSQDTRARARLLRALLEDRSRREGVEMF